MPQASWEAWDISDLQGLPWGFFPTPVPIPAKTCTCAHGYGKPIPMGKGPMQVYRCSGIPWECCIEGAFVGNSGKGKQPHIIVVRNNIITSEKNFVWNA